MLFVVAALRLCAEIPSPLILFTAMTGNPDAAEVEKMFSLFREAGFGQMMLYPRSGLECEYMGEDWLKLVGRCLEAGKRRGMKVWLYDEYNWPSGPFGVRASRSGNLTPSAQANITILPLRPPAIHRTPLAALLRNAHCVRGICTRRRTNALPSHRGRNRRDIERVHTVTFYVLFAFYLR